MTIIGAPSDSAQITPESRFAVPGPPPPITAQIAPLAR
jgi:hypothetical protein